MYTESSSNVAWFKLAEFIARREKERAFSIYRLLAHSLHNDALSAQLEGDLYAAFHDDRSTEAYVRAAQLYERQQHAEQAIEIYKQLILRNPDDKLSWAHYTRLCEQTNKYDAISQTAWHLIRNALSQDKLEVATACARKAAYILANAHTAPHQLSRLLAKLELTHPACIDAAREALDTKQHAELVD